MKVPVSVEYVRAIMEQRANINRIDFRDIELYEKGEKLDIPEKVLSDFEFTGLNNIDFIWSDFYKGEKK